MNLNYKSIDNGLNPSHVVIMLHGLGANSDDFSFLPASLKLDKAVRFIFPDAPVRSITINNGYKMQAWYDILSTTSLTREVDYIGIDDSISQIDAIIQEQLNNDISQENIIIAGFSQGGVIAYYTLLNSKYNLAGALIMSSYLPDTSKINLANIEYRKNKPLMIMHGSKDSVVDYQYGKQAYDFLLAKGFTALCFQSYSMEHQVVPSQIMDISKYINRVFS